MDPAAVDRDRLEDQFRDILECLQEQRSDVELLTRAGTIAFDLGRRQEAFLYLSRALDLDPSRRFLLPKLRMCAPPDQTEWLKEVSSRPATFAQAIAEAYSFPFKGSGVGILLFGSLSLFGLNLITSLAVVWALPLVVGFVIYGYLSMWWVEVCKNTAVGTNDPPHWPDFTNWEELFWDWAKLALAKLAAFFPVVIFTFWFVFYAAPGLPEQLAAGRITEEPALIIFAAVFYGVFILLGAIYLPMALMGNAILGRVLAAWNPAFVFRSIWAIRKEYALCLGAFLVTGILTTASEAFIRTSGLFLFVGLPLAFLEMYVWAVLMRLLGSLYRLTQRRLRWMD